MNVAEFLGSLEVVKKTGQGKFQALCPSHDDRHPSLNITEGEQGILLKCWTGCSVEEICQALGIHVRDLFYDTTLNPQQFRRRHVGRQYKKAKYEVERMAEGFQIDAVREAERYLKATVGTDISTLDARQLDTLMNSVCDALAVRLEEERGEYVNG